MRRTSFKSVVVSGLAAGLALGLTATAASAQSLLEKAEAGETVRIGFANEVPWAYPGDNNEPLGFVNVIALGVLEKMGITDVEPVVTEWGGLIPGLQANRFDIITGGMYILESRCENVAFSKPVAQVGDAFIVPAGNPKGIQTYADIKDQGATLVTGAGYNIIEVAKQEGVPESNIMTVPGPTEILASVRAGRADAGGVTFFTAQNLAEQSGGDIDVTDPNALPDYTLNWAGIAFRQGDADFVEAFDAALDGYLGSDEMMAAVAEYGYAEANIPDDSIETSWVCENR
ncbi:MAG TPA: ectoine/hydroxyectoine ABC transporter substrate-binding protein EhuB [Thermohalobaculum sp.]|nr:ectoine/hydroxyectoine ABC transporter substrate-binding protein EhuB [Thermohalobaculum sp.]